MLNENRKLLVRTEIYLKNILLKKQQESLLYFYLTVFKIIFYFSVQE